MNSKGVFITFDGPDGCGKSTQSKCIYEILRRRKIPALLTREPGGTKLGERVRKILLDRETGEITSLSELLLYMAGRAQHVETIIKPALYRGMIVLCDRFIDASEAYQGYGRGVPLPFVRELNRISTGGLFPDRTILIDFDPKRSLAETSARSKGKDRMESLGLTFHKRVRKGYFEIAAREPERIRIVPRAQGIEKTTARIQKALEDLLP